VLLCFAAWAELQKKMIMEWMFLFPENLTKIRNWLLRNWMPGRSQPEQVMTLEVFKIRRAK
jgi:hypothetical protein